VCRVLRTVKSDRFLRLSLSKTKSKVRVKSVCLRPNSTSVLNGYRGDVEGWSERFDGLALGAPQTTFLDLPADRNNYVMNVKRCQWWN
jgi:hypothetical protein